MNTLKRASVPILALALVIVVSNCVGNGVGLDDNGNPLSEGRGGGLQPTWRSIQDNIFTPKCASCHPHQGLDFSEAVSYDQLVGRASAEQSDLMRVNPGDPDNSYIIRKLEGDPSISGVRMPADEKFLSQAEIDVIRLWIANGAPKTGNAPTPPVVTALNPAPGSSLNTGPTSISATFSKDIDGKSVSTSSFSLIRSGGDGTFADGNEVTITPLTVGLSTATTATMDLSGVSLPDDTYRITLAGDGASMILESSGESALDGEFSGTFPSGDGAAGGDFSATFTVSASITLATVSALTPAPGATLTSPPAAITVTFSEALDSATMTTTNFQLVRSGADGSFTDGNEATITSGGVTLVAPLSGVMDLSGVSLPNDVYQITLVASGATAMKDGNGNALDGEYSGAFPSGDGTPGGDFVTTFTISTPARIIALSPPPGGALASAPTSIIVTFSQKMDSSTVNQTTVLLLASGGDGTFGDSNENIIMPSSLSLTTPTTAVMGLSAVTLAPETYQITIIGDGASPVTDASGNALDGEFNDVLPSGDGTAGGDFVSTFSITASVILTTITDVNPATASSLGSLPSTIAVTFSQDIDGASVTTSTFLLVYSGGDGTFADGNEVSVSPSSVSLTGPNVATMNLTGIGLVDDVYQITIVGSGGSTMKDSNGNIIDGDNDGGAGGNFTSTFTVSLQPQWLSIQEHVFTPTCIRCHKNGGPNGLDLDEANSFAELVNVNSKDFGSTFKRVNPGDPDNSYLIMKLEGDSRIKGKRMPRNGPPYLSQATINVIRQWIIDGAKP